MGWWTEYASRNNSICGQNFLIEIAVFTDGGSTAVHIGKLALFSSQKFWFLATVVLSFLFDKHCPITE